MVSAKRELSKKDVPEPEAKWAKVVDDLEIRPLASIGFSKNGKLLGTAKHFDAGLKGLGVVDSMVKEIQWQSAVFPHVLLKNVVVLMQFSIEDRLVPFKGAAWTPLNYIIDQTNVFKSARQRKLRLFANFQKISVVVLPKPEELKICSNKISNEMGKEVAADAVNNMLVLIIYAFIIARLMFLVANYVLPVSKDMPGSDELFDKSSYPPPPKLNFVYQRPNQRQHLLLESHITIPGGGIDPYSRPASVVVSYGPSMVEPSPMGSARASPFTNHNISGQFNPIAHPQSDWQNGGLQGHPQFCLVLALPHMISSPYGTPMVRPSNENFPANSRIREEMPPITPGNY
ncbi:hypothetical protein LWI28_009994 [Acer negundo]|uniref:Uncharacterized protein n=1 Tax=Acer negundo TaxID=4023 RepID=A0AAD5P450_ACENE|nr:hypothetical protein LWI28_009994 [Acer negundo]